MKILLAVDGSPHSKRMLAWLVEHDDMLPRAAMPTVLTVVPEIPRRAGYFDLADPEAYYRELADEVLQPVRAFLAQQQRDARVEYRVGHPAEQIAAAAEAGDHDLVVMGSHGHGALAGLLLGSVVQGVLSRSRRPLLIVR